MSDIDQMKLRRLDLTVLLVFLGLMRHRKAVAVADDMGLTQSSISHALARLRDLFDDPLFLRRPHGLDPTAVALALEPKVRLAVETLDAALAGPAPFDPSTATRTLRIAAYDSELAALVPGLIGRLGRAGPGLRLAALPLGRRDALEGLEAGTVDLALGFIWDLPPAFDADPLYEEGYRLVARRGHPLLEGDLTAEAYAAARHLVVSPAGDLSGIVDRSLEALGLSRTVVAAVPLFFPALAALAGSDLVATLPARVADRFAPAFGLATAEPPVAIRRFPVTAVRHRRDGRNPMTDWLVGELRAVAEEAVSR